MYNPRVCLFRNLRKVDRNLPERKLPWREHFGEPGGSGPPCRRAKVHLASVPATKAYQLTPNSYNPCAYLFRNLRKVGGNLPERSVLCYVHFKSTCDTNICTVIGKLLILKKIVCIWTSQRMMKNVILSKILASKPISLSRYCVQIDSSQFLQPRKFPNCALKNYPNYAGMR